MKKRLLALIFSLCICSLVLFLVHCDSGDDDDDSSAPTPTATATAGPTATPTFNPGNCTPCHGFPPATGSHEQHISVCSCSTCHAGTTNEDYDLLGDHGNAKIDVEFSGGGNWDGNTCSDLGTGCHGTRNW